MKVIYILIALTFIGCSKEPVITEPIQEQLDSICERYDGLMHYQLDHVTTRMVYDTIDVTRGIWQADSEWYLIYAVDSFQLINTNSVGQLHHRLSGDIQDGKICLTTDKYGEYIYLMNHFFAGCYEVCGDLQFRKTLGDESNREEYVIYWK